MNPPADADPTWRYPWPAGQRMAADLPALADWRGRRVCELGCGQGRVGLAALAAGAAQVTLCDISPEPLELLARSGDPRITCHRHAWGDPVPGGPYDLVVGGDILYRPTFFARLVASIASGLEPGGVALLGDPRTALEPDLMELLAAAGLAVSCERRPGPYTLLRAVRPG